MKTELALFSIDGSCCGNQDRMTNPWMKLGGCAALAAVDSCLLLSLCKGVSGLCPMDFSSLNWETYNAFAETMRPYLSPRMMGVNKLHYYLNGFRAYLRDQNFHSLSMDAFPMGTPVEEACGRVKEQISQGFPVPILHLKAQTPSVSEYEWHWFLLTGYEEDSCGFLVKAVTFGESEWLRFADLWHETDPENGGLILYRWDNVSNPADIIRSASVLIGDRPRFPERLLAAQSQGESPYCYFPNVSLRPDDCAEEILIRELAEKWNLQVTITGLLAVNEYDVPPFHFSERCYKAVLTDGEDALSSVNGDLVWLSEETFPAVRWRACDEPLINIIRSDMTDVEVIRKRIAEKEATEK